MPDVFEKLSENYNDKARFTVLNVAVGKEKGEMLLYRLRNDCPLPIPSGINQLASINPEHIEKHLGVQYRPYVAAMSVPCETCTTLLQNANVSNVDLLLVDTEGFDYKIVSSFPFSAFKPKLIIFEHKHLGFLDWLNSIRLMWQNKYRVKMDLDNLYCFRIDGPSLHKAHPKWP
jgi:FkbM family methyltransferase